MDDVVGVYDADFRQLIQTTRPMRASVSPSARLMTHPREDGALIADHRIIEPLELELFAMLTGAEYKAAYQQLDTLFRQSKSVTIQTRASVYTNMVLVGFPHDEEADAPNAFPVVLRFMQVLTIVAQFQALPPRAVRSSDDSSASNRGEQSPTTPPAERRSRLRGLIGD